VTSYVESILEDLVGEESPQEALDIEAFSEMMMAYLPQSEFIKVRGGGGVEIALTLCLHRSQGFFMKKKNTATYAVFRIHNILV
jgi:hypothetical protein